jgi:hypothetical protein
MFPGNKIAKTRVENGRWRVEKTRKPRINANGWEKPIFYRRKRREQRF